MMFVATNHGVLRVRIKGGEWQVILRSLTERKVTALAIRRGKILAGTTEGVFVSSDEGETWAPMNDGLSILHIRSINRAAGRSSPLLAGTEPAGVFRFDDSAGRWIECPEVARLRDRYRWYLPYSSEAGAVRGFAFHGKRVYAAVEVGGMLRSDNGGKSWRLTEGSADRPITDPHDLPPETLHSDVHSVVVHPSDANLVYAPTGGGLYRSRDGGKTWALLYSCYCRAVWVDPENPDHLILGPAEGVSRMGRIEDSRDGGATWQPATQGIATPWANQMVRRFYALGEYLFALVNREPLLVASPRDMAWKRLPFETAGANAIAFLQD